MKERILAAFVILLAFCVTSFGGDFRSREGSPCHPKKPQGGPDGEGPPDELDEPVYLPRGEFFESHVDISLPGRGLSVYLERTYRSRTRVSTGSSGGSQSALGLNWSHNYEMWVDSTHSTELNIYFGNERAIPVYWDQTSFSPFVSIAEGYHGVFESDGTAEPMYWITSENTVYKFKAIDSVEAPGMLESITDRNGNVISLTYEAGRSRDRVATVSDAFGNTLSFSYYDDVNAPSIGASNTDHLGDLLWKATDQTGREVEYVYQVSSQSNFRRQLTEVILPAHETVSGTFDLPSEHARFPSGRTIQYEYDHGVADYSGLLTKISDENGVDILENFYINPTVDPDSSDYEDVWSRRLYKQEFAGDIYTHMLTNENGTNTGQIGNVNDFAVWIQKRTGTVVKLVYSGFDDFEGGFRLLSRTDFPGVVPAAARGKLVWLNEADDEWFYASDPEDTPVLFGGPVESIRTGATPVTKVFSSDEYWNQTVFEQPNGIRVEYEYNNQASDPRSKQALMSITTKPAGSISSADWIVQSFEHDFSFWPGGQSSCGCGSGTFATAIDDGEGNRTEKVYELTSAPGLTTPTGNLLSVYHDIPSAHTGIVDDATRRSHAAAVEHFTYDDGGNVLTHTHPETTRLVAGSPVSYTRVDEFVYYSDTYGTLDSEIASRGKLRYQRVDFDPVTQTGANLVTEFEYDAIGNISKIIEPDDDVKTYLYNQARQLVREQHWDSTETVLYAQTDYFYDANGNLVIEKVTNLDESQGAVAANPKITTVYEYNERDELITKSVERSDLQNELITQDSNNLQAVAPIGSDWVTEEWEYDENGNMTLFRDGEGNEIAYQYDFRDLLYRTVEGSGSSNPLVTQFNYDDNKRLEERITNPDATNGVAQKEMFGYDGHSRLASITDPMGNVANFDYDKNHNQIEVEVLGPIGEDTDSADTAVLLYKKELEYDSRDLLKVEDVSVFDYLSGSQSAIDLQTTNYFYNDDWSISRIELPSGDSLVDYTVEYFYDTVGRTEYVIDVEGNQIKYAYDADSNISQIDQYDQSSTSATEQQFVTTYDYDALDRRISRTDGVSNDTVWGYDSRSNQVSELDARENVITYDYDGLNRLIATRVQMTADGDGFETTPVLDSANPEITTTIVYDDSSRVISEIDDNGHQTDYEYDAVNRRTKIMLPGGSPTRDTYTTEYNGNGQAVKVTDARGVILNQEFDLNSRMKSRAVDGMSVMTPDGALHEKVVYDGLGRILTATNFKDSAGSIELTKVSRAYDSRSHVLREIQNVDGANGFPSAMDRVVNYEFDLANNPTRILYPHGRDIRRGYDSINRLVSIADHEPTTPMAITDFNYIGRRLDRRVNGNNTETAYTYDGYELAPVNANDKGFGRVVGITTTDSSSSAVLDDFEFTWDASQNRTSYNDVGSGMKNRRERAFSYDSSDRLVSTDVDFPDVNTDYTSPTDNGVTDYALDGVHNRFSVTGFEDAGSPIGDYKDVAIDDAEHVKNNQYTYTAHENGGSWINTYDANGNLTFRAEHNVSDFTGDYVLDFFDMSGFLAAHGNHDPDADLNEDNVWDFFDISMFVADYTENTQLDHQYFTYDFRNQLIKIELKSGADTPVTVTNTYDAFARRVVESVGESPDVVSMQFVYGCASLWEVIEQIQLETTTALEYVWSTHVYGLGIDDEVSYRMESSAEDFWSHRDDLNSLTSVSNHLGEIKERYEYGDFGKPRMFDPATGEERVISDVGVVHLYTGRSLIMGTGLFDYRHRVMDPETGGFRQRDPLGYFDSMNMYQYAISSPWINRDPFGLTPRDPIPPTDDTWISDGAYSFDLVVVHPDDLRTGFDLHLANQYDGMVISPSVGKIDESVGKYLSAFNLNPNNVDLYIFGHGGDGIQDFGDEEQILPSKFDDTWPNLGDLCSSIHLCGCWVGGNEYGDEIIEALEDYSGVPVTSTPNKNRPNPLSVGPRFFNLPGLAGGKKAKVLRIRGASSD